MKVNEDELDFDFEQVAYYQNQTFSGIGYSGEKSSLYTETSYKNGLQDGEEKTWKKDKLISSALFYKSMLHGETLEYFDSGELKIKVVYELGMELEFSEFDKQGNVTLVRKIEEGSDYHKLLIEKRALDSST